MIECLSNHDLVMLDSKRRSHMMNLYDKVFLWKYSINSREAQKSHCKQFVEDKEINCGQVMEGRSGQVGQPRKDRIVLEY